MRKTINTLVALIIGAAVGAVFMWAFGPQPVTNTVYEQVRWARCATEDSCTVEYHDGFWYIGPDGSAN